MTLKLAAKAAGLSIFSKRHCQKQCINTSASLVLCLLLDYRLGLYLTYANLDLEAATAMFPVTFKRPLSPPPGSGF